MGCARQAELGEGSHHSQAGWGGPVLPGDTALARPHGARGQGHSLEKRSSCGSCLSQLPVPVPPQQGCHPALPGMGTLGAEDQGSPPSRCLLSAEADRLFIPRYLIQEHLLCCQEAPQAPSPSSCSCPAQQLLQGKANTGKLRRASGSTRSGAGFVPVSLLLLQRSERAGMCVWGQRKAMQAWGGHSEHDIFSRGAHGAGRVPKADTALALLHGNSATVML